MTAHLIQIRKCPTETTSIGAIDRRRDEGAGLEVDNDNGNGNHNLNDGTDNVNFLGYNRDTSLS